MRKILLNRGRWGITFGRMHCVIIGLECTWDYYGIITSATLFGWELCVEFIHYQLHKRRWNKNGLGFRLSWDGYYPTNKFFSEEHTQDCHKPPGQSMGN